ncbi:alpha-glycosidase [Bacillus sp. 31A1R]|uniref:Alpha-glycosidase n=1 Tax=Robertmurraya mangrovi TaxID=3098077 RepID=A0ABU5IT16_9BACI|nr:alpha-glycosidase [Bacillus sp. 31A1R]MDZ5470293.1 alpha-glycosidase [Bacillus sp. 31A1R]
MERSSVYHRPTDQFAYPYDEESLHIKLRTKRDNVDTVELYYGDQYEWVDGKWISHKDSLEKIGTDTLFDYWLIQIKPEHRRIRYGFLLTSASETILYTEKGFFSTAPEDPGYYFSFPFLHTSEVFRAPSWVKDTVWYQIFPERFGNGDPTNDPKGSKPWASEPPARDNFFGGDFQGVIDHLDYLVDLGITGIYFTPIFKAHSNHKYDTIDYLEIDPQFGDKEKFKELVKKCHENGIKVMLDAVFNHSGFYFEPFQDVLEKGEQSKYSNWFHTPDFPLKGGERPNYATFAFEKSMPKFNTQNKEVKDYLLEVGRYWVREFDIDGWRLDVANEVDHQFWREFRTAVKEIKPDLYILGEIWHDSMPWLRGDQFDAVMNYPFLTNVLNLFSKETITAKEFVENMTSVIQLYPENVNEAAFNLVGSHDTPRILTECKDDLNKVKLIYTFMLTFIGTPCIYYGDEIGLRGEMDPGCRACMPWDKKEWNEDLRNHVKGLLQLRKSEKLLANEGSFQFLDTSDEQACIAFMKKSKDKTIVVLMNPTSNELEYSLPFSLKGKKMTDLKEKREYAAEADQLSVHLKAYDYSILAF